MGGCRCIFRKCKVTSNKSSLKNGVHFFHFPVKDPEKLKLWVKYAAAENIMKLSVPQIKNKVICNEHFHDEYFMNYKKDKLTRWAIPTIVRLPNNFVLDYEKSDHPIPTPLPKTTAKHLLPPTSSPDDCPELITSSARDLLSPSPGKSPDVITNIFEIEEVNVKENNMEIHDGSIVFVSSEKKLRQKQSPKNYTKNNITTRNTNNHNETTDNFVALISLDDDDDNDNDNDDDDDETIQEPPIIRNKRSRIFDSEPLILNRITKKYKGNNAMTAKLRPNLVSTTKIIKKIPLPRPSITAVEVPSVAASIKPAAETLIEIISSIDDKSMNDEDIISLFEEQPPPPQQPAPAPENIKIYSEIELNKILTATKLKYQLKIQELEQKLRAKEAEITKVTQVQTVTTSKQQQTNKQLAATSSGIVINQQHQQQQVPVLNKTQLYFGIKKYLCPSMATLVRMEMFGGPEREWKQDEKDASVDLLRLGVNVFDYFRDEWRFRLPSKKEVHGWIADNQVEEEIEISNEEDDLL